MNCLWLLLLGQALVVVRTERENAEPKPIEDDEAPVEPTEPEKDEDDEDADFVEEEEEEEPAKPAERPTWLPTCQLDSVDQPELKGDHTCRLSLTVKRQEFWTASDSHELYLRGTEAQQPAKGAKIATADGFTRFKKKVTIKYTSKGKKYEATLKRGYCKKNTVCKLKCKGQGDVDEIVNSPVDALTYTLCDLSGKRGPTMFKMFYKTENPKLDTIVRMTYGVFGSVKYKTGKDRKGREIFFLPLKIGDIHKLLKTKRVIKTSMKNGMLSDGNVDPADPSKFIPKPEGQIRYSAQNVRGKYGKARDMYFVDVHSPWSAIDAFAYSLAMSDNAANQFQGKVEDVKSGWKKMFG